MDWPKQNTGLFAVPLCVQCCTYVPPDKYEISSTNVTGYLMVGTASMDGSASGKLYRTVTWSGGFTIQYSNDCSTVEATSTVSYSGSSTRNLGDFVTSAGTVIGQMDGVTFAEVEATSPGLALPSISPNGLTSNQTETTDGWSGNGNCVASGGGFYNNERITGTATAILSNICTEEVSLAYQAEQFPGWADWTDYPMDEFWDYVASATYTASTPGSEGYYAWVRMKFRRTKGGFTPGASYVCTMEAYRAPAGTYEYVLYATMETTLTADAAGTLVWEGETPFARGYGTWVKARSFTATPA